MSCFHGTGRLCPKAGKLPDHGGHHLCLHARARRGPEAQRSRILGEDEDRLHDISIEMEPEDAIISVYGLGQEYTPAFTNFGIDIDNLRQVIENHRWAAGGCPAKTTDGS